MAPSASAMAPSPRQHPQVDLRRSVTMNRGLDAPPRTWYVPVLPWAGPGRLGSLVVLFWPLTTTYSMPLTTHSHPPLSPSPTFTPPPLTPKGFTDAPHALWHHGPSQVQPPCAGDGGGALYDDAGGARSPTLASRPPTFTHLPTGDMAKNTLLRGLCPPSSAATMA